MDTVFQYSDVQLNGLLNAVYEEQKRRAQAKATDPWSIIKGQEMAKRAALVAVAGHHSILFVGPPLQGKTMLRAACHDLGLVYSFEAWPCPCGHYGQLTQPCVCTPEMVRSYHERLSPTRITVAMPVVPRRELEVKRPGTGLADVESALRTMRRYHGQWLTEDVKTLLRAAERDLGLLTGQWDAIVDVARTIANLDQSEQIMPSHVCEAISYARRPLP